MTDQPEPQQLNDADLLAWAVIIEYRSRRIRDGAAILLPYPPCPACRSHVIKVEVPPARPATLTQPITMHPCGHGYLTDDNALDRIRRHADAMLDILDGITLGGVGQPWWNTDGIIREAHVRVGDQPEPEDTCRPVDVDGETIRVRGASELTDEGKTALAALVQAAKVKFVEEAPEQVGVLQNRLGLAHKARRAKDHQLDDIRRALCDIGFMQDDDPYSHADLADVIRQNGPAATEATDMETTARVFAGLHRSAEQDVTRVIALYERWVKEGAPPLGTSIARWWDKRLVELHEAIKAPADQPKEQP